MYKDSGDIITDDDNKYKQCEKKYKVHYLTHTPDNQRKLKKPKRAPMPELNHVIDFSTYDSNNEETIHTTVDNIRIQRVTLKDFDQELYAELEETFDRVVRERNMDDDKKKCDNDEGEAHCPSFLKLPPPSEWKVYTLVDFPGFFFISQLFTPRQQLFWIQQCLETYSQPPNLTNHYPFVGLLQDLWVKAKNKEMIESSLSSDDQQQPQTKKHNAADLVNKMAWTTLGYQYDWTNRKYHPQDKVPFPEDSGTLVSMIACATQYTPYLPEAAIVNYYNKDKSMGGHKDDAEYAMDKPIVSLSFGSDAIFLLGGETKKIDPIPMLLHSGDLMIMGGRSRDCFHGVARVIDDSLPHFFKPDQFTSIKDDSEKEEAFKTQYQPFIDYLNSSTRRLNINVRQVFSYDEQGNLIDPFQVNPKITLPAEQTDSENQSDKDN